MKDDVARNYAKQFEGKDDIREDFLVMLRDYRDLIPTTDASKLAKSRPLVPEIIKETLNNPMLCIDENVSDVVADCLLSFMCPEKLKPSNPAIWAADVLVKRLKGLSTKRVEHLNCSQEICKQAIIRYPKDYLRSVSDAELKEIAEMNVVEIANEIGEELQRRNFEIPLRLFESFNLKRASLGILVSYFEYFMKVPVIETASKTLDIIEQNPPLHLFFVNKCFETGQQHLLAMLGKLMKGRFPMKYPLWSFYHRSLKEITDEIEAAQGDPIQANMESFLLAVSRFSPLCTNYLLPLLIEFPDWFNVFRHTPINVDSLAPLMEYS